MKKLLSMLLALVLIFALASATFAVETSTANADKLFQLGLFKGTGTENGKPVYELEKSLTRAEAITMVVRFYGKEADAQKLEWTAPFTDVLPWAQPYVQYAYTNGITNGISDTEFGSNNPATDNMYLTFLLRLLGYTDEGDKDFTWRAPYELAKQVGLVASEEANTSFVRADTVDISCAALKAVFKNDAEKNVADMLIANGAFTQEQYYEVFPEEKPVSTGGSGSGNTSSGGSGSSGGGNGSSVGGNTPSGESTDPEPTAEEIAEETVIAGNLEILLENYNASTYKNTVSATVQNAFRTLMSCVSDALTKREAGQFLSRAFINREYASQISQLQSARRSFTDNQKTEFANVVVRIEGTLRDSDIYDIMDYFGVS